MSDYAVWEIRKVYGIDCEDSETRPEIIRSRVDHKDIFRRLYNLFLYYEEMKKDYPDVFYIIPMYSKKGHLKEFVVVYKNNNGGHSRYKRYYIVKHVWV